MFAAVLAIGAALVAMPRATAQEPTGIPKVAPSEWIQLFNGKNLDGWTPKFTHHDLGENFHNTFRVEDGLLKVRYDDWPSFTDEFGHLFYKDPFSYYVLAAEYRFVGEQVKTTRTGLDWAIRNNGLMIMSPDPKTMMKDQDFPISIEVQLLGGLSNGKPRSTANLCTPGTNVVYNGKLHTPHCTTRARRPTTAISGSASRCSSTATSSSATSSKTGRARVLEAADRRRPGEPDGSRRSRSMARRSPRRFISIQAETAPAEFRKIELLNLEGCMDKSSKAYRPYFVKSNPARCK